MFDRLTARLLALVGCLALARGASAQTLGGTVRDSVSLQPIPGAVVIFLDSAGGMIVRRLTNERGEYSIQLRDAMRTVRFVRIGFVPRELPVPAAGNANARLDATMAELPSMLQAVRVVENSLCSVRKDRAAALGLWEQARAGLLATIVARETNPAVLHRLGFHRLMDGNSDRIESMRVRSDSADTAATSFFASHSARDLVRYGFSTDSTSTGTFFGPDADVLLNEYFAGAYCFEIERGSRARPNQIGLRFLPAEHRRGRVDIDGTLWIDTLARSLKDIEFMYDGVPAGARRFHPGGRVSFQTMPNGVVLIDRWSLRLVSAEPDTILNTFGNLEAHDWLYADESGGELAHARWPDGTEWNAPLGALRVETHLQAGKPAAGTVIALAATQYFGVADPRGLVVISDLLPGPYVARIIDPQVAVLGIGLPTPLRFVAARDTTSVAKLTIPTARSYTMDRCKAAGQRGVNENMFTILGRVVMPNGMSVEGAKVSIATHMSSPQADGSLLQWLKPDVTTGSDGLFQACHGWNVNDEVLIRVHRYREPDVDVPATITSNMVVVRIPVAGVARR